MSIVKNRLPKSLRLYLKSEIDELFSSGNSIKNYPLNAVFKLVEADTGGIKVAFSVPKRIIKLASDRNLVKRRLREAYRLNSLETRNYFSSKGIMVHLLIVFNGKKSPDYVLLESKIILILQRLVKVYESGTD